MHGSSYAHVESDVARGYSREHSGPQRSIKSLIVLSARSDFASVVVLAVHMREKSTQEKRVGHWRQNLQQAVRRTHIGPEPTGSLNMQRTLRLVG